MPVQYSSILKEHDAVRHRAGLFDLSHMGQFWLTGEMVAPWADTLTINAVGTMKPMQARYNIFCNDAGGTHDDTIFYRLERGWLLVVNASNADKMWAHLQCASSGSPAWQLENRHERYALIAIQGPKSVEMLQPHVDIDLGSMRYYFCAEARVNGVAAIVARTGYTGEDGFELFVDGAQAPAIWSALLDAHARRRPGTVRPGCARRAASRSRHAAVRSRADRRDHAGSGRALNWAIKLNKPEFVGKEALERQLAARRLLAHCRTRHVGTRAGARGLRGVVRRPNRPERSPQRVDRHHRSGTRTSPPRSFRKKPQP